MSPSCTPPHTHTQNGALDFPLILLCGLGKSLTLSEPSSISFSGFPPPRAGHGPFPMGPQGVMFLAGSASLQLLHGCLPWRGHTCLQVSVTSWALEPMFMSLLPGPCSLVILGDRALLGLLVNGL